MKTLKKEVIQTFAEIVQLEALQKNKIILTTPFGLIAGRLVSEGVPAADDDIRTTGGNIGVEETAKLYSLFLTTARERFGDGEITGNDGYLLLTDVVARGASGGTFNAGSMVVFYDQIIGVSIGEIE